MGANRLYYSIYMAPSHILSFFPASSGNSTVGSSFSVLRENEKKLKDLVRERFSEAVERDNWDDVERFSRLFPLLNLHEEGLDLYAGYLRSKVGWSGADGLELLIIVLLLRVCWCWNVVCLPILEHDLISPCLCVVVILL